MTTMRKNTDLQHLQDRCQIDEAGCWVWRGGTTRCRYGQQYPRVYLPSTGKCHSGTQAAIIASTGQKPRPGHRAYHVKCSNKLCCNPAHITVGTTAEWGAWMHKKGAWRGNPPRITANRATARRRSVVSPELLADIKASEKSGLQLSKELGINQNTISKARRGLLLSVECVSNPFAALIRG